MLDFAGRFTCDVTGRFAFGIECNTLEDPDNEFLEKGLSVFKIGRSQMLRIFANNYPTLARWLRIKLTPDVIEEFFLDIVKNVVQQREADLAELGRRIDQINNKDSISFLMGVKDPEKHLLDGNTERPGKLSVGQIAAQGFVFFLAVSPST